MAIPLLPWSSPLWKAPPFKLPAFLTTDSRLFHTNLLVFSSSSDYQLSTPLTPTNKSSLHRLTFRLTFNWQLAEIEVKVRVILRSSWRQGLWGSRSEIFATETLRSESLCNILFDEKMGLFLMNVLGLSWSVRIAHVACYCKFFILHYVQVLCQSRLCKADHAYLTYLMLQW
jgi:hypothetical protein